MLPKPTWGRPAGSQAEENPREGLLCPPRGQPPRNLRPGEEGRGLSPLPALTNHPQEATRRFSPACPCPAWMPALCLDSEG